VTPAVHTLSLHDALPIYPEKIRVDVVVAGLVDDGGTPRIAPGGEGIADAYGKSFGPLLSTLGARGKAGEVTKVSTAGTLKSPLRSEEHTSELHSRENLVC